MSFCDIRCFSIINTVYSLVYIKKMINILVGPGSTRSGPWAPAGPWPSYWGPVLPTSGLDPGPLGLVQVGPWPWAPSPARGQSSCGMPNLKWKWMLEGERQLEDHTPDAWASSDTQAINTILAQVIAPLFWFAEGFGEDTNISNFTYNVFEHAEDRKTPDPQHPNTSILRDGERGFTCLRIKETDSVGLRTNEVA